MIAGEQYYCHNVMDFPVPKEDRQMRAISKRWRWGLALVVLVLFLFALYSLHPWRQANAYRVVVGMTQEQVEALLGPPNYPQDVKRKHEAFWDSYTVLGWGQYVAITVHYDAEGKVERKDVSTFWRNPWE